MSEPPEPFIYQLKVLLLGISPMIRRRLLVCSRTTITGLHHILQITMGWSDDHLHMFRIHGKPYGIARAGGLSFSDDPCTVRLDDFRFRINETFFYENDFTDDWRHQIRLRLFWLRIPSNIIRFALMAGDPVPQKTVVVQEYSWSCASRTHSAIS